MGAAGVNQIWWLTTNPFTGLLLHPNSYRIMHLPLTPLLVYRCTQILIASCTYLLVTGMGFFFNNFASVTGNEMIIIDVAGCSRCQSRLVVEYQPLFRFTAAPKLINRITCPHQSQPDRA
jgi:hypothetical protein